MKASDTIRLWLDGPSCGWIGLRLEAAGQVLETSFSYTPEDSVLQLAEAACAVVAGSARRSIVLHEESPELQIVFDRGVGELVSMSLLRHPDHRRSGRAKPLLGVDLPAAVLGRAVWRALRALETGCTPAQYEREWRRAFPTEAVRRLGALTDTRDE